jgi:hypothetical protein
VNVRLPNFLIVGAPKCGTTSIASYIAQHPDVYLSPIKEPKFFSAQFVPFPLRGPGDSFVENFTVKTFEEYQRLFHKIRDEKAIGEASVDYLYFHRKVIPLIQNYLGDVKIIIVPRNPVKRAFSAYKNLLRDSRETLPFEEALQKEEERRRKGYEYLWSYLDSGFYYAQVKAYMENFSRIKVLILEHFDRRSLEPARRIFKFLEVDPTFKPKRQIIFNVSGRPKLQWLQRLLNPSPFKGKVYKFLATNGFAVDKLMGYVEFLRGINIEPIYMKPNTRQRLQQIYKPDVEKLQHLLKLDLSSWFLSDSCTAD